MDFSKLKKSSNLEKLTKAVEAMSAGGGDRNDDSNEYWKLSVDKSGNGFAIIRFLPTPPQDIEADGLPWVKYFDHGFQGPGGWYIEKSLTTLGQEDPVSAYNSELWSTGLESNKEIARKQKRRLHYVANIYVVKDSKNPENEGRCFKYIFGKKIFEKITGAMNPQFEDEQAFDPFDLWNGANFKLKVKKVDGYPSYESSEFESPAPLFEDDAKLEKIWKQEYSLLEILNPKNFKSYAELDTRLKRVLGLTATPKNKTAEEYTTSAFGNTETKAPQTVSSAKSEPKEDLPFDMDDDEMSYFASLVDE